jgi:hypothetical protein
LAEQGAGQLRGDFELLANAGIEGAGEPVRVQLFGLKNLFRHPTSGGKVTDGDLIEMRGLANFTLDCSDCFQYRALDRNVLKMSTDFQKKVRITGDVGDGSLETVPKRDYLVYKTRFGDILRT